MIKKQNKFLLIFLILLIVSLLSSFFVITTYAVNCSTCGSSKHEMCCPVCASTNHNTMSQYCFGKPEEMVEPFTCPICKYKHDMNNIGSLNKAAYDMECVIQTGGTVSGNLETIMKFDVTDDSTEMGANFVSLWNRGKTFYDALLKIGELLCLVYGLIELMGKNQISQLDGEQVFKSFIKIFIGIIIIRMGFDIITAGIGITTQVFNTLQTGSTSPNPAVDGCVYSDLANSNFLNALGPIASNIMPWIVMMIATVLMQLVVWARLLDLMVRVVFAPIGMADIMYGGMNSNGMRYLKKIVSAAMQGAVLLAMLITYGTIVSTINQLGSSLMVSVIMTFTLISTLFKAKEFADSMLGV